MKASYAYGPVTVAYSNSEYDSATATNDKMTNLLYAVSYTVSDAISVTMVLKKLISVDRLVDAEYRNYLLLTLQVE